MTPSPRLRRPKIGTRVACGLMAAGFVRHRSHSEGDRRKAAGF